MGDYRNHVNFDMNFWKVSFTFLHSKSRELTIFFVDCVDEFCSYAPPQNSYKKKKGLWIYTLECPWYTKFVAVGYFIDKTFNFNIFLSIFGIPFRVDPLQYFGKDTHTQLVIFCAFDERVYKDLMWNGVRKIMSNVSVHGKNPNVDF